MIPTSTNNGNNMNYNLEELKTLDIDYDGETTFGNYTIKVKQDETAESPREWDNLGTMVCWGGNAHLGDINGSKEYESSEAFLEEHKDDIMLPLYLYDHSGITINTGGFSCQWDSGQLGWIYVSKERIRKEFSCKRVSKKMREKIETYLTNEVKTYDDYLTGNVYWFNIVREDPDGEEIDIDTCGGYYGDPEEYMYNEIRGNIKLDIEYTPQQGELFLN